MPTTIPRPAAAQRDAQTGRMRLAAPVPITDRLEGSEFECDRYHFKDSFAELDFGGVWRNVTIRPEGADLAVIQQAREIVERLAAEALRQTQDAAQAAGGTTA